MTDMYKIRNHLVRQYEGLLQCEILICQKSKPLEFKTPVKSHKGWACTWMWGIFSSESIMCIVYIITNVSKKC